MRNSLSYYICIFWKKHSAEIDRRTNAARTVFIKINFNNNHKSGVMFNKRGVACFPLRQTTGIGVPGRERTEGLILSTHFANFHTSIFSFFSSLPLQQKTRHLPTILLPSLSFRRFFRNERRRSCKKSIVSR